MLYYFSSMAILGVRGGLGFKMDREGERKTQKERERDRECGREGLFDTIPRCYHFYSQFST